MIRALTADDHLDVRADRVVLTGLAVVAGRPVQVDGDRPGVTGVVDGVQAGAAEQDVRDSAGRVVVAQQRVVAVAALEPVLAVPAVEVVVAAQAAQGVVAEAAGQHVVPGVAGQPIVAVAALDPLEVGQQRVVFARLTVITLGTVQIRGDRPGPALVGDEVDAAAPADQVGSAGGIRDGVLVEPVLARPAVLAVVARPAVNRVLTGVAVQPVVALGAVERVVTGPAVQLVGAEPAGQRIATRTGPDHIVAFTAGQRIGARTAIELVVAVTTARGQRQVRLVGNGVVPGAQRDADPGRRPAGRAANLRRVDLLAALARLEGHHVVDRDGPPGAGDHDLVRLAGTRGEDHLGAADRRDARGGRLRGPGEHTDRGSRSEKGQAGPGKPE